MQFYKAALRSTNSYKTVVYARRRICPFADLSMAAFGRKQPLVTALQCRSLSLLAIESEYNARLISEKHKHLFFVGMKGTASFQ